MPANSPGWRFCPHCGGSWNPAVEGSALRCDLCSAVTYRNPAVGVAVLILEGDRVLLGRRSRGRYAGLWCVPCGYVEWGEDVRVAAEREFREETGLTVEVGDVAAVHSNFHDAARLTVGIWFHGRIAAGEAAAADDLDRVEFFSLADLPPLAFPTDAQVLAELKRNR